mgnify:CR=1 FL=1
MVNWWIGNKRRLHTPEIVKSVQEALLADERGQGRMVTFDEIRANLAAQ